MTRQCTLTMWMKLPINELKSSKGGNIKEEINFSQIDSAPHYKENKRKFSKKINSEQHSKSEIINNKHYQYNTHNEYKAPYNYNESNQYNSKDIDNVYKTPSKKVKVTFSKVLEGTSMQERH